MKRARRTDYQAPDYPDTQQVMDRRKVLIGLGCATAAAATTLAGCPVRYAGDIDDNYIERYWFSLPLEDSRRLDFIGDGYIDYFVEIEVDSERVEAFAFDNAETIFERFATLLQPRGLYAFEEGQSLEDIEAELLQALNEEWALADEDTDNQVFWGLTLSIVHWEEDWIAGAEEE